MASKYINLFIQSDDSSVVDDNGSSILLNFNPALHLHKIEGKNWYCKCVSASIPYISPNITNKYSMFLFSYEGNQHILAMETGLYDVMSLQTKMDFMIRQTLNINKSLFQILPDTSTGKVYIKALSTDFSIQFDNRLGGSNVMQIIGFLPTTPAFIPTYNGQTVVGTNDTHIDQLQVINLHVSFVSSSYQTNQSSDVLCSINPNVTPYSRIQYDPQNPPICMIDKQNIYSARVELRDQNGILLNMSLQGYKEPWSVNLQVFQE